MVGRGQTHWARWSGLLFPAAQEWPPDLMVEDILLVELAALAVMEKDKAEDREVAWTM